LPDGILKDLPGSDMDAGQRQRREERSRPMGRRVVPAVQFLQQRKIKTSQHTAALSRQVCQKQFILGSLKFGFSVVQAQQVTGVALVGFWAGQSKTLTWAVRKSLIW
jgi:hypothetical protein